MHLTALRDAGALNLYLVTEINSLVVGHVAFSPLVISDGTKGWYGLGLISVLPNYQRQGIGNSLINKGLFSLKESGGQGCTLVGDTNYFQRLGFKNYLELVYDGIPKEFFPILPFKEKIPQGTILFHKAFLAKA